MSELKPVSPLLDGMNVLECFSTHGRTACYYLEHSESKEQYVLKHISIPESDTKTQALILTGAVADVAGAQTYYEEIANDIRKEVIRLQKLSDRNAVAPWSGYQVEPNESGIGFDVYLLMPRRCALQEFLKDNAMTQLQALNFGIDLCNALRTLHDAGFVYLNLKPENIFVDALGRYMIGDLGLMPRKDLHLCAVPEDYLSDFSAPELRGLFAEPSDTSDIYSLGMILYYIFNGNHLPHEDEPHLSENGDCLPTPVYADYELAEIIIKACNPDPEVRWSTPADLHRALTLYMQRNEVSDQLLVPPLPLEEAAPEETEPAENTQQPVDTEAPVNPADTAIQNAPEPAQTETPTTESEPDNPQHSPHKAMTIEEILDSVNDVLADKLPQPNATPNFEANIAEQKEAQPKKKRGKIFITIGIILVALSLLGGAFTYFYNNWYLVTMEALAVTECTDDSISISYRLSTPDPDLSWTCIDSYGNSFPGMSKENGVIFAELTPGTQYTIRFYPGKLHKLLGTTAITETTATQTQIVSFTAGVGGNSTTADINMVVSGPESEEWTLTYFSTGGDSGSVTFSGHNVQIPDLQLHNEYTFTLQAPEGIYLAGEASCTLNLIGDIQAKNLTVAAATEDSLSVSWESMGDAPLAWTVHCVGTNYDETVDASVCAATFHGTNLDTAYTFTLSAEGLEIPLTLSLPANATILTSLDAQTKDAGTVLVEWSCSELPPEEGWIVRYLVGGDEALCGEISVPEGNTALLCGLPANTEIIVTLAAANGDSLIGTQSVSTTTMEASDFNAHNYAVSDSTLRLYPLPSQEEWSYDSLGDPADTFDAGADVAVVLEANAGLQTSGREETSITLVLRSENGKVVKYKAISCTWNDMWKNGRYLTDWVLPNEGGSYSLELCLDNQYAGRKIFTVNAAEEASNVAG